jgi:hypothetical protein
MSVIINGNGTITNDAGAGIDFGGENISTTGVVSGVGSGLTAIPAANLTGTLAAGSGANLTALNASELGSGTIPDGRFPGTLPAASAANLTAIPAANISGVVPPANLGTGTANSGTFLNGSGAYSAPGGGAFELVATAVASNSATLTITGLNTDFENYLCIIDRIVPVSAGAQGRLRVGDSSGIKSASNDYKWFKDETRSDSGSNTHNHGANSASASFIEVLAAPNNTNSGASFAHGGTATFTISGGFDGNAGHKCYLYGTHATISTGFEITGGTFAGASRNVYTVTQIQLHMSTGNISSGRMTVWGIKHT